MTVSDATDIIPVAEIPESRRVALITSVNLVRASDAVPAHHRKTIDPDVDDLEEVWDHNVTRPRKRCRNEVTRSAGRNEIVQSLLIACGLQKHLQVVSPEAATLKMAAAFHDADYLETLRLCDDATREELLQYNLVDDSYPFPHVAHHALWIAGASLTAASLLIRGQADIAINLCGGRHHAFSRRASGFCFINDVVLASLELQKKLGRVMVIDIDVHHGDGTERAFLHSNKVMTISFHQREPGFFPGTGDEACTGKGKGLGYNVNVAFTHKSTREEFMTRFETVVSEKFASFSPVAVVFVCGVDALKCDPRGNLSLTPDDIVHCSRVMRDLCCQPSESEKKGPVPLLVTGAGGYHFVEAAKTWTRVVAELANAHESLSKDIPEHEHFELYGPSWQLYA